MTKQDVYDIVDILEPVFQQKGWDIRQKLKFRFENSPEDLYNYDSEKLFIFDDGVDEPINVKNIDDNLYLCYKYDISEPEINLATRYNHINSENWVKFYKYVNEKYEFFRQICENLEIDFFILEVIEESKPCAFYIKIKNFEANEGLKLKKYHQF